MGDGGLLVQFVGCLGKRQRTEEYKQKACYTVKAPHLQTCQSRRWIEVGEAFTLLLVYMVIDCETAEDRHNSLQAGIDGPVPLGHTGNSSCPL